jgi:amino acid transporter
MRSLPRLPHSRDDEQQPGYQTILSQLIGAVAGCGVFYYSAIASIFVILAFSAQTSFGDFPRVCRLLAEDGFLPSFFANRGRRLVFSSGIVVLVVLSGVLLIAFGGVTEKLIPLFAIGAFGAFAFSQVGMIAHWRRKGGKGARTKLVVNAIGATTTSAPRRGLLPLEPFDQNLIVRGVWTRSSSTKSSSTKLLKGKIQRIWIDR